MRIITKSYVMIHVEITCVGELFYGIYVGNFSITAVGTFSVDKTIRFAEVVPPLGHQAMEKKFSVLTGSANRSNRFFAGLSDNLLCGRRVPIEAPAPLGSTKIIFHKQ